MFALSLRVFINKRLFSTSSRWRYAAKDDPADAEFLMKLLDIQDPTARRILEMNPISNRLPRSRIAEAYTLCVENGINNTLLLSHPGILFLKPFMLEQRIFFYKELGCSKLYPYMISFFPLTQKFTIRDYKEWKWLPDNHDIVLNIYKYIPGTPFDTAQLKSISENYRVYQIHRLCMRQFLKWKLGFTDEKLDKMESNYFASFTSVSTLKKSIEILETEFELPKQRIKSYIHHMNVTCNSFTNSSNEFKEISDIDLKAIVCKRPKLLKLRIEMLRKKVDTLLGLGIPAKSIQTYPDILYLSEKSIIERVKEFKSMSEIKHFSNHPQMLRLVFYIKMVKERFQHLKECKVKCITVHLLTCSDASYKKRLEEGIDRSKGVDLVLFLTHELGDSEGIRTALLRHPLWCHISLEDSYETVFYLKERNYSNEDISKNIHIVLYSRSQIERELNKIETEEIYQSWQFTSSQKLAMCLYNIEKVYHFNGHGVFNCPPIKKNNATNDDEEEQTPQSLEHTVEM